MSTNESKSWVWGLQTTRIVRRPKCWELTAKFGFGNQSSKYNSQIIKSFRLNLDGWFKSCNSSSYHVQHKAGFIWSNTKNGRKIIGDPITACGTHSVIVLSTVFKSRGGARRYCHVTAICVVSSNGPAIAHLLIQQPSRDYSPLLVENYKSVLKLATALVLFQSTCFTLLKTGQSMTVRRYKTLWPQVSTSKRMSPLLRTVEMNRPYWWGWLRKITGYSTSSGVCRKYE